ncbi:aspartyl-phosphate phosphatase Spo0E family protein [Paenibacillus polymyxa]|uniref:aspartyl-phosphate phosphatase Spo0E family protein n=1 Tax=Paenibacillus polymyxa TaxID=1406 RepID=UPI001D01CBC7|nr:aspartyl-phosphate phosphatase Spo0E family protein [Paenibacillus polymyxa]
MKELITRQEQHQTDSHMKGRHFPIVYEEELLGARKHLVVQKAMEIIEYDFTGFSEWDAKMYPDRESLEEAIALKRQEMHNTAVGNKLSAPVVVKVSQELDALLNLYNRIIF